MRVVSVPSDRPRPSPIGCRDPVRRGPIRSRVKTRRSSRSPASSGEMMNKRAGGAGQALGRPGKPSAPESGVCRNACCPRRCDSRYAPDFRAARITSLTKRVGCFEILPPSRIRPGRDAQVVVAPGHGCTRLQDQLPLEKLP